MFVQKRKTQFELAINEKQKRMTKLNVKGKSRLIKQTKAYIHNTLHYSNKQKAGVRDFGTHPPSVPERADELLPSTKRRGI